MSKSDRLLLERQFREAEKQAINEELDQRIRDHAREVARSQRAQQFRKVAKRQLDFLAIGDSWYDYPLDDNILFYPWDFGIIGKYNLKALGDPPPIILSLAHYGWASTQALSWENQERMIESIKRAHGPTAKVPMQYWPRSVAMI